MTSEVALLNKSAIALAADSATTVTYWDGGRSQRRYFKGANKIFNLSVAHPVGLMTYASASLQGVPWEILAKAFRTHLGTKSHDHLSGYATDFFDFVQNNNYLYPITLQDKQFLSQVERAAVIICFRVIDDEPYKAETDTAKKETIFIDRLNDILKNINAAAFIQGASQGDIDAAIAKYAVEATTTVNNEQFLRGLSRCPRDVHI